MTEPDEPASGGVLSSLPTTRPQRRSPKRTAGPTPAAPTATPRRTPKRTASPTPAAPTATARRTPKRTASPTPAAPTATPRRGDARRTTATAASAAGVVGATPADRSLPAAQGFNARATVDPPSRTDLLGSVLSGAGEIAEIGLSAGRHVLRSIYGRLPRP